MIVTLKNRPEPNLSCEVQTAPIRGGLAPWATRRTIEIMRRRLWEDIKLDELAAEARLSPFHFARMFKKSVGLPPRVYLTKLRLEKACELLESTDLPITEIAHEVGYSSNQVFARVFFKHRRMSPSDHRRAVRDPFRSPAPVDTPAVSVNVLNAPAGTMATAYHRRGPDGELMIDVMLRDPKIAGSPTVTRMNSDRQLAPQSAKPLGISGMVGRGQEPEPGDQ